MLTVPRRRCPLPCPLPGAEAPFGQPSPHDWSRSALVLSQHLDGFLQRQGCAHIAARYRPGFVTLPRILVQLASQRIRTRFRATHTLKDGLVSKSSGRNALIRPLHSKIPDLPVPSVGRENGALRGSLLRHRMTGSASDQRACRTPRDRDTRTGSMLAWLVLGADPQLLHPHVMPPKEAPAPAVACWPDSRGAGSVTGLVLGSTRRATTALASPKRPAHPKAPRSRWVLPSVSPSVGFRPAALPPAPGPRRVHRPAVLLLPLHPRCSARHSGRMPVSTPVDAAAGGLAVAPGAPEGSPHATGPPLASAPGVPDSASWGPAHRSDTSQWPGGCIATLVAHGVLPTAPRNRDSTTTSLPCRSATNRSPCGMRFCPRPCHGPHVPEGAARFWWGVGHASCTTAEAVHLGLDCADLGHHARRRVTGSELQRSLPQGRFNRGDAESAAEAAPSAPSSRAGTRARSTG